MRRLSLLGAALCLGWLSALCSGGDAAVVLAQSAPPTAGVVLRPVRVRPPRVRPVHARPRSTPTPTGTPLPAVPTPKPPAVTNCDHACPYSVSQMRMLWYGALSFTAVIKNSGGCGSLTPDPGDTGTVQMTQFVTAQHEDTGHDHIASFVLGDNGVGVTSLDGTVQFSRVADSYTFTYSAPVPAFTNIRAGQNFPVAFSMCVTVGNQAVRMHLVCQGKSQGMLCHEG